MILLKTEAPIINDCAADGGRTAVFSQGFRASGKIPLQYRKQFDQAIAHHLDRQGGEDQAENPGHHVDSGFAEHLGNRLGQRESQRRCQRNDQSVADQCRQLQEILRPVGIDHHGGHGRRAGQQRNGQRHHADAGTCRGILDFLDVGARFGGLCVQHRQRRGQQQHAATDLETGQRNVEKLQQLQAQQRADGNDGKRGERSRDNGAPPQILRKPLCVMDEEGNDGNRIGNCQQRQQGFDVHENFGGERWRDFT